MDGKTFRAQAMMAVEAVVGFLDEFPELYCVIRMRTKDGTITVGLDDPGADDDDDDTEADSPG